MCTVKSAIAREAVKHLCDDSSLQRNRWFAVKARHAYRCRFLKKQSQHRLPETTSSLEQWNHSVYCQASILQALLPGPDTLTVETRIEQPQMLGITGTRRAASIPGFPTEGFGFQLLDLTTWCAQQNSDCTAEGSIPTISFLSDDTRVGQSTPSQFIEVILPRSLPAYCMRPGALELRVRDLLCVLRFEAGRCPPVLQPRFRICCFSDG